MGDKDTGAIKYLYCHAKNVFDWVGEVSSRLQPPSQSQTLSRKKYRRISSRTIGRLAMTDKNFENIDKKFRGPSYTP